MVYNFLSSFEQVDYSSTINTWKQQLRLKDVAPLPPLQKVKLNQFLNRNVFNPMCGTYLKKHRHLTLNIIQMPINLLQFFKPQILFYHENYYVTNFGIICNVGIFTSILISVQYWLAH